MFTSGTNLLPFKQKDKWVEYGLVLFYHIWYIQVLSEKWEIKIVDSVG